MLVSGSVRVREPELVRVRVQEREKELLSPSPQIPSQTAD
jgi:hypothetical protein